MATEPKPIQPASYGAIGFFHSLPSCTHSDAQKLVFDRPEFCQ